MALAVVLLQTSLLRQLGQPEYESIKQVISGELKAVDTIIQEFIHSFELQEVPSESVNKSGEDEKNDDN